MSDVVRSDVADHVMTLTIDRPDQRNALNADVTRALLGALDASERDDAVRVVVLTGAGDRAFSAGADLGGVTADAGAVELHRARALFADLLVRLRRLRKPVIARINGAAVGGGFGLALACDLAVAADHATFGTTEIRVGMWPYMISAVILDHVGPKRMMDLALSGRRIDAAVAAEWGLVNQVVPAADLDGAVGDLAAGLAAHSPVALGLGKESIAVASELSREQALPYLASMLSLHLQTEDAAEGIAAFLDKRPPRWRGR